MRFSHFQYLLVSLLLIGFLTVGCSGERAHQQDREIRIIEDMLGREVAIPVSIESVVCLRAGALRMLVYLDATEYAAAIEEPERTAERPYLMARSELRLLPSAGPLMGGDLELLVAAAPDVIFMTFTTSGQADQLQSRTGIPVIALEYGDFSHRRDTFFESLQLMASVLGKEERADQLIAYVEDSLENLNHRTSNPAGGDQPSVYIGGVSYSGTQGISSTEPFYPPFRFVNASNVAENISDRMVNPIQGTFVDKEQIIQWNPDVMFVDLASLSVTRSEISIGSPLYSGTSALRNGQVYGLLPYNNYAANYENILANSWYVGSILYPEAFSDVDLQKKVNEVFEAFLGRSVYEDMQKVWGELRRLDRELL